MEPSPRRGRDTVASGTLMRELTTLSCAIDDKKRELGILVKGMG